MDHKLQRSSVQKADRLGTAKENRMIACANYYLGRGDVGVNVRKAVLGTLQHDSLHLRKAQRQLSASMAKVTAHQNGAAVPPVSSYLGV